MVVAFTALPLLLLTVLSVPGRADCDLEAVQPTSLEAPVLAAFDRRIDAYMRIHNEVERTLGPERLYDDPEDMFAALDTMRSGIRAARRAARRGDIFTADVAVLVRLRLVARLALCNETADDVLAFINEEREPATPKPGIHDPFPWALGSAMPAELLPALPALPAELQYRFAGRDLVLIDLHADLVVDILVNALPASGHAGHGTRNT